MESGQLASDAGSGPLSPPTPNTIREHMADLGMQRRLMTRYPRRFAKLDQEAIDKITTTWLTATDDAMMVEQPDRRAALKDSVMRTMVMAERVHQDDEHLERKLNQDDKHLGLDAAKFLSQMSEGDKLDLITKAGLIHMLPKRDDHVPGTA